MARKALDQQLDVLNTLLIELGRQVDRAIAQSLEALKQHDNTLCHLVITSDNPIDDLRAQIEMLAFRLLTLQQPLGCRDIRFLTAALTIAGDLERAGDGAAGIATLVLRMLPLQGTSKNEGIVVPTERQRKDRQEVTEASIVMSLLTLGQEAQSVLAATMRAFTQRSAQEAQAIWQEDDVVDVRYHLVRHDLMTMLHGAHAVLALQQDSLVMQRITYLFWIAHKLERIADHCTNICERIVFIVTGDAIITPTREE